LNPEPAAWTTVAAYRSVRFKPVPDLEEVFREIRFRERSAVHAYAFSHCDKMWRGVQTCPWINISSKDGKNGHDAPTFHSGFVVVRMEVKNAHVEPLPLVPVTWMTFNRFRSAGCHSCVKSWLQHDGARTYLVANPYEIFYHLWDRELGHAPAGRAERVERRDVRLERVQARYRVGVRAAGHGAGAEKEQRWGTSIEMRR
jgi:hypothetical protein